MIPCCSTWLCRLWHHWLNPLGNWNEPWPYPEKRAREAAESWMPAGLWWALRNPFHNFNHYWIGITPLGDRCTWRIPQESGWVRSGTGAVRWWRKRWRVPLPFIIHEGGWTLYAGWLDRGNFGLACRRNTR